MTNTSRDTPNVMIFPPLIPLSVLVVGVVLNFSMPLERKFGDEYRRYKTKVPRYWWRF